jgi:hypothetical protein
VTTPSAIALLQEAARTLGLQLVFVNASTDRDLGPAFASFSQHRVGAVLVSPDTFYNRRMEQLAALAPARASTAPSAAVEVVLPTPALPDVTTTTLPIGGSESVSIQCVTTSP